MEQFILGLGLLAFGIYWYYYIFMRDSSTLPPGPRSFPIVGSLLSIKPPLHKYFANVSKQYGSIFSVKLGMVPYIIVNSADAAEQVLKVHDAEFAYRPSTEFFRLFSFNWSDLTFRGPGKEWRNLRKICSVHLFSNNLLNISATFRRSELLATLDSISQLSSEDKPVNLRRIFGQFISNSLCLTLFGKKGLEIVELVEAVSNKALTLNIGEIIPVLDRFDLHGVYKDMKSNIMPRLEALLNQQVQEHRQRKNKAGDQFVCQDFTDVLLSLDGNESVADTVIVALLADLVAAGLDTTVATLEWTMAELINNPQILDKAQSEIDEIVGKTRMVEENDLPSLHYVQAIVKETLRLHPVLPLGLPHQNAKQVNLDKYTIPTGCNILVNVWSIGRDPGYWEEPTRFIPERFLKEELSVVGKHLQFIPFSSGRRMCVGYPLAMRTIPLLIAVLAQKFNWNFESDFNMEENTGTFTCKLESDLVAMAFPRT